jgi:hypothetical protein
VLCNRCRGGNQEADQEQAYPAHTQYYTSFIIRNT